MQEMYDDGQIRIEPSQEPWGYFVFIGDEDYNFFIKQEVLADLIRTPRQSLAGKFELIAPEINFALRRNSLNPIDLGFALAQIKISRLEEEVEDM